MSKVKQKSEVENPAGDEQLALLSADEENALFLPAEELRKKYTAKQAEKMEWRRNACVRMLAYGIPAEDVARDLHMNLRTVAALGAKFAREVIAKGKARTDYLEDEAMADLGAASAKRATASFKDLHIGAGIKLTHVATRRMMEDSLPPAVDVEAENGKLTALREKIKQLKPPGEPPVATPETQPQMDTDQHK